MIQRETKTAPAQKRIVFIDRIVGQGFIATDIQRADGDGLGGKRLEHLLVNSVLLFLAGEGFADHKGEFRAIKPDAIGSTITCGRNIR